MVSTTEKYALEIEIFTLSRGFRGQISRSGAQKRRFQRSVCGQSGRTDFFNRIDPKPTITSAKETCGNSSCRHVCSQIPVRAGPAFFLARTGRAAGLVY
ncbi:hypothetical protein C1X61_19770 [Pseudomonas sp. FW215-T2]|nr:hypothetical protein C1X61_19770 [Pseudomonas sp. FW215-T2]PNA13448.1 hypothetical protein C1X62_09705 [Pseudomonas sp. FW215-R3]PNB38124.1 hypothetical protein C1X63_09165 [Pseudomonas sp. FW305-131]